MRRSDTLLKIRMDFLHVRTCSFLAASLSLFAVVWLSNSYFKTTQCP